MDCENGCTLSSLNFAGITNIPFLLVNSSTYGTVARDGIYISTDSFTVSGGL